MTHEILDAITPPSDEFEFVVLPGNYPARKREAMPLDPGKRLRIAHFTGAAAYDQTEHYRSDARR
jgi:hypothetical protein